MATLDAGPRTRPLSTGYGMASGDSEDEKARERERKPVSEIRARVAAGAG